MKFFQPKGIDKGKHEAMKISAKALKSLGQNEEQTSHPCRSISTFIHQKISEKHNRLHSFKPSPKIL